ncbi:hypothetical protein RvVAR0630_38570 [Agrobacterium vitis]|uniref:YjfK family protein n=1 Tax=Agrobacterium vitis TaxID=373 RepID=UPI0015D9388D|nr:YjfK family protein [Agrobacterium vitis]BCH61233.1 hypothetical protein RvVAR0630_38570 [Agrobacterium vitis]
MLGWFSGRKTEKPMQKELGPLGAVIGGALDLDFLSLEADALGAQPAMPLPQSGAFIIAAYGEVRLDAASVLSRYYDENHHMIQVMSPSGMPGDGIEDISFYRPWDSVVPVSQSEWNRWTGPSGMIGAPSYDADGILFNRFWGEGPERAETVQFVEEVEDGETSRSIHQSCMLYYRPLGTTQEMLLINVERDLDPSQAQAGRSVEFLIGYGIGAADVRRV